MKNPDYKPYKTPRSLVTPDYLRDCFNYNPITGILSWKDRPKSHFPTETGWKIFHSAYAGKETGCMDHMGYLIVLIGGRPYPAHRIAWAIMTGTWPEEMIDHVNGVRHDNRWENLREATRGENLMNSCIRKDNKSGVKGVMFSKPHGKWRAVIRAKGVRHHLGYFESLDEAAAVVRKARAELHREFTRHE